MQKQVTIKEIAEIVGVSKSTVSRYLNGGKISKEKSNEIRTVIEKYNYEPNAFAQSLKAKSTRFIGIIAPRLDSVVTSKIMMSMDEVLRQLGYKPIILNTNLKKELELESLEQLIRLKVDGILLLATEITSEHRKLIDDMNIPIVIVGQKCEHQVSITYDDYNAGKLIGQYVREQGSKNVIYLGVPETDQAVGVERKKGVMDGLLNGQIKVTQYITDFSMDTSYQLIRSIPEIKQTDAIICATDKIAFGVIRALKEQTNLSLDKMIITGFGGYEMGHIITPSLTTIRFLYEEAGSIAAKNIHSLIEGKEVVTQQTIGFEFIQGYKNCK